MNIGKRQLVLQSVAALLLGAAGLAGPLAQAQQGFPDRPVRVIVPFAPGNTLDTALRQVAEEFRKNTGQQLVVDNRPGGSGLIAAQTVMNAPADGYTLLLSNISMLAINPHTFSKLPYDADNSFKPVTGFLGTALVMAVPASVPASNLAEFADWVKAQPAGASYASFTAGNASHFAGVILQQRTGLKLVHVPYNGTPPAVQALLAGQVQAAFLPLLAVKPHVESGRVKVLAVSSPQRSPLLPDTATFREQGFPELDIYIWAGLSAPAATPDAAIERLNAEFDKALRSDTIRGKWRAMDFEPLPMRPDEFRRYVQTDSRRWADAVKASGFKGTE